MGREARLNAAIGGGNSKRTRIQNWMLEASWQINDAQTQGINTTWVIAGRHASGVGVAVAQPAPYPDLLVFEAAVILDEKARSAFEALEPSARRTLIWELQVGLLQLGVEFNGFGDSMQQVTVSQFIYDDGLTKDAFMHRLHRVKDAAFFLAASFGHKLGQPQENWQDNIHVN